MTVDTLLKIGEAFRWVCGAERLHARLQGLFEGARLDVGALPLHRLLVRLSDHVPAIYTTNFDDLLERAFAAAGKPYQVVAEARDLHAWCVDEVDGAFVPPCPSTSFMAHSTGLAPSCSASRTSSAGRASPRTPSTFASARTWWAASCCSSATRSPTRTCAGSGPSCAKSRRLAGGLLPRAGRLERPRRGVLPERRNPSGRPARPGP